MVAILPGLYWMAQAAEMGLSGCEIFSVNIEQLKFEH